MTTLTYSDMLFSHILNLTAADQASDPISLKVIQELFSTLFSLSWTKPQLAKVNDDDETNNNNN